MYPVSHDIPLSRWIFAPVRVSRIPIEIIPLVSRNPKLVVHPQNTYRIHMHITELFYLLLFFFLAEVLAGLLFFLLGDFSGRVAKMIGPAERVFSMAGCSAFCRLEYRLHAFLHTVLSVRAGHTYTEQWI